MKILFKIGLVILVSAISLFSQQVYLQWAERYNGSLNYNDESVAIKVDAQGYIYIAGTTYQLISNRDYLTIKYDPDGNLVWLKTYNGEVNGGDYSFALALDNNGNVYVTGRSDRGAPTLSDYTTIKYNSAGVQQWVAFYNGPANGVDEARSIAVDNSGNVYVTGRSWGINTGQDFATVKYDANGNQLWAQRYDGPAHDEDIANSITLDLNGNVYVAGYSLGVGTGDDAVLIKYSNDGVQQWVQRYNNYPVNGGDVAKVVKTDANNNVYITGFSDGGATNIDYLTIKYNSSGVQQWLQKYNGIGYTADQANALVLDQYSNVYVTGSCSGLTVSADSIFTTVKYNSDGVQQWIAKYYGPFNSNNIARDLAVDNSGNVYVTGSSYYYGFNNFLTTIKYNMFGVEQWIIEYSGPITGDNFGNAIALDNDQHIYVTGKSWGVNYDAITIKYGPELENIKPSNKNVPLFFVLKQNYPNPFNPTTSIEFGIPVPGLVKLSVFDINGKLVDAPVNQFLSANNYSIKWNASNYNSGVYFYKLQVNGFSATKKMILLK